jgi:HSP20 family protein
MAEVKVNKQSSEEQGRQQSTSLQRRQGGGLARRGEWFPSFFSQDWGESSPFALMRRLTDEMDRMFSGARFSQGFGGFGGGEIGSWSPAVEVAERDNKLVVTAELPGLNKDDVKVHVTDDGLVIEGERKQEHEETRGGIHRSERSYGRFYRLIPLPEGANVEQAQAQFNNGVLEVTLPIPEEQQRRRQIPVQSGGAERREVASESAGERQKTKAG